jgi:antitoxin VapB
MADSATTSRRVRLFRNNRNQAIRIPVEFELPGTEAILSKEGDRLVIQAVQPGTLRELLASWEPIEDELPNVDEGLQPVRDIEL